MKEQLLELSKQRRSIYALGRHLTQTPDELADLIKKGVKLAPTAFNSQTTRAVILFNDKHEQLWDIVAKRLESEVPSAEAYQKTLEKNQCVQGCFWNNFVLYRYGHRSPVGKRFRALRR